MALEVAELSCQFVTDFAFKVVCVDTAGVAVDVVLSGVVLAHVSIAQLAHVLDDAVRQAGVLLPQSQWLLIVTIRMVNKPFPGAARGGVLVHPLVGRRIFDCDVVEALGVPSRGSLDRLGDWDAVDLLEHGAALDRVGMVACRLGTGFCFEVKLRHCPLFVMFDYFLSWPKDPNVF